LIDRLWSDTFNPPGRHLVRARYLDDAGRWDFEIERELSALVANSTGDSTSATLSTPLLDR